MRPQKVSVNVWQMIFSSCSYLFLAVLAWVLLRLVQACFWFPAFLNNTKTNLNNPSTENKAAPVVGKTENNTKDEDKTKDEKKTD